jgi:UDP-glucose 4-epimerase
VRLVVTGATGNVGSSVVERLVDDDVVAGIVGVVSRRPDWCPPKTRWVTADVAVNDLDPVVRGADAVIHLAWAFQPTTARWRPGATTSSTRSECSTRWRRRVYPSWFTPRRWGAYSPRGDGERVDESWPTNTLPTAAYGREKSYVERVLDTFERDHPDVRVVRLRRGFISSTAPRRSSAGCSRGPLLPNGLLRPDLMPVVPGLRLQALDARYVAAAYQLAVTRDVYGPVQHHG